MELRVFLALAVATAVFFLAVCIGPASAMKISKDEHNCTPGELVWVNCNLCMCNLQGHANAVCAKMWCQPTPKYQYESSLDNEIKEA